MITITITMEPRPAKRRELLQTLDELTEEMRRESGFVDTRIGVNDEQNNELIFIEEWETQADVNAYVQSPYFRVLKGALKVLTTSAAIEFADA